MPKPEGDYGLFDIMYSCRAMRRLKPDPIPEEILMQLVDGALQGPSGSNSQNWHFIIVREPAVKERMAAVWKRVWGFYCDALANTPARPGEDLAQRERMRKASSYMVEHLADAPAVVVVAIKKDEITSKALQSPATVMAAFRHLGVVATLRLLGNASQSSLMADGATAYPVVQNLLLTARALGLGAVLATPHLFVPGQFEEILNVPAGVRLAAIIPVGYPKGNFGPVGRPKPAEVVSWDSFTQGEGAAPRNGV